ncbi:nSTAND1 domain-containing NTPase [Streptomyces sp. NBC_01205]|uniref:nSTAND1 domain-containing NTPase n=1 Tax=Streptomyces sp. NBC_01205 TaxID=2903771 RepID=UPI002E12433B
MDNAYVTPVGVLRELWPDLAEQEVCPYRGLEPFTAEEARWFVGRKDAVRQVLANLARQQRLTLLLGPSGSGKSSLVEAGVLPALAAGELPGSDRWLPVVARPRQDLLAETERAGSADDTVRLWDVLPQPAEAIRKICRSVHRDLTPEERAAYLPGQSVGAVCTSR